MSYANGRYIGRKDGKGTLLDLSGKALSSPWNAIGVAWDYQGYIFGTNLAADGKWGYMDNNGKVIIQPLYDSINVEANGFFRIEQKDKAGLLSPRGKVVIEPKYGYVYTTGHTDKL